MAAACLLYNFVECESRHLLLYIIQATPQDIGKATWTAGDAKQHEASAACTPGMQTPSTVCTTVPANISHTPSRAFSSLLVKAS